MSVSAWILVGIFAVIVYVVSAIYTARKIEELKKKIAGSKIPAFLAAVKFHLIPVVNTAYIILAAVWRSIKSAFIDLKILICTTKATLKTAKRK